MLDLSFNDQLPVAKVKSFFMCFFSDYSESLRLQKLFKWDIRFSFVVASTQEECKLTLSTHSHKPMTIERKLFSYSQKKMPSTFRIQMELCELHLENCSQFKKFLFYFFKHFLSLFFECVNSTNIIQKGDKNNFI